MTTAKITPGPVWPGLEMLGAAVLGKAWMEG